jgi:hypothetical protein
MLVDEKRVKEGRVDHMQAFVFSTDEGADGGMDLGTLVTDDYEESDNRLTGKIYKVR